VPVVFVVLFCGCIEYCAEFRVVVVGWGVWLVVVV